MKLTSKQVTFIYILIGILCFTPLINAPIALVLGIILSLLGIKQEKFSKFTSASLKVSIVLMGFGMNLSQVISTSKTGFIETAISVVAVMLMGLLLAKLLKVEHNTGLLISAGTAICGGSAIAAVSSVLSDSKNYQISFSLAVIFILNAIALFLFPFLGHHFGMSQELFGQWAAIAIHDTSSVVGAGAIYGEKALEVATTVKLIRALWIIPLSLVIAFAQKGKNIWKIKFPLFIIFFVVAIVFAYLVPEWNTTFGHLNWLGKRGMVLSLFFIGSGISIAEAKKAGLKSFLMGIFLWLFIGISSFFMLNYL